MHTNTDRPHLAIEHLDTPIGTAVLVTDAAGRLRVLDWLDHETRMRRLLEHHYGPRVTIDAPARTSDARRAVDAYFAGDLDAVNAIPTETCGTPFQRTVWQALRRIGAGTTMSYGDLASAIGVPRAARAVGLANGANPIGVVVPCHRVIGADGSLTGYGGGLERKRWLLEHEARWRNTAGSYQPPAACNQPRATSLELPGLDGLGRPDRRPKLNG